MSPDTVLKYANPVLRWASAAVVLCVFLLTIVYILFIRLRWADFLVDILQPISLPERYSKEVKEVVEGISIASGIPAPEVLVIKNDCLNAFALSRPGRTLLFFTRGLLTSLDREELTAVTAHEFAHIKNGDMDRFSMPESIYWDLLKAKAGRKEWLSLVGVLLPVPLWVAVIAGTAFLASLNPKVGEALLMGVLFLGLAIPMFMLFLAHRPRYKSEEKGKWALSLLALRATSSMDMFRDLQLIEFEADREALSWTYYPEGLARALNKCHGRSCSPPLFCFDGIAFVGTRALEKSQFPFFSKASIQPTIESRLRYIWTLDYLPGART